MYVTQEYVVGSSVYQVQGFLHASCVVTSKPLSSKIIYRAVRISVLSSTKSSRGFGEIKGVSLTCLLP